MQGEFGIFSGTRVAKLPDVESLHIARDSDDDFMAKFEGRSLDRFALIGSQELVVDMVVE